MNVNGLGGAASLPMTLPSSSSNHVATTPPPGTPGSGGTAGATAGTGSTGRPTGELRLPGQPASARPESTAKPEKEIPKPAPLPPLRGLTVAEIRAMLGVAPLAGQAEAAAAGLTGLPALAGSASAISPAAFDRYA